MEMVWSEFMKKNPLDDPYSWLTHESKTWDWVGVTWSRGWDFLLSLCMGQHQVQDGCEPVWVAAGVGVSQAALHSYCSLVPSCLGQQCCSDSLQSCGPASPAFDMLLLNRMPCFIYAVFVFSIHSINEISPWGSRQVSSCLQSLLTHIQFNVSTIKQSPIFAWALCTPESQPWDCSGKDFCTFRDFFHPKHLQVGFAKKPPDLFYCFLVGITLWKLEQSACTVPDIKQSRSKSQGTTTSSQRGCFHGDMPCSNWMFKKTIMPSSLSDLN